jgi:hypothetical protein
MRRLFGIAAASLLLLAGRPIRADGSIPTAELLEMLSQSNPKLVQTLRDGFDLDKDAQGGIVGRAVNPGLAGTRIGPYTLHGRLRKADKLVELVITLNTDIVFADGQGHKTGKVSLATGVKETFRNIQIETAK